MSSDKIFTFINVAASVFMTLFFVVPPIWKGTTEKLLRRKNREAREALQKVRQVDERWNEEALVARAKEICGGFYDALSTMNQELLSKYIHPAAWADFQRDLVLQLNNKKRTSIFKLEFKRLILTKVVIPVGIADREMLVYVEFSGTVETWTTNGLQRSRFVSAKEFWLFRRHLDEWRVFNRCGLVGWWRLLAPAFVKPLPWS